MGGQTSHSAKMTKNFYFGDVFKKKHYGKDLIVVTKPIMSQDEYEEWKEKVDLLHGMNKDSLFVPEGYELQKVEKGGVNCCCGTDSQVQITYEDISYLFSSEIENRKKNKYFYQEPQLMLIMYQLLLGGKEFQKKKRKFGDIRPKNILVTTASQIKMVNVGSFPWELTSIEKYNDKFDHSTIFYFAPEQLQYVSVKGYSSDKFPNPKTQAWSIGLTMLQAATLETSQTIYNKGAKRSLNNNELQQRMRKVSRQYPIFYEFLSNVLRINEPQRMSSGEAWAAMQPYSERITQLQPFRRNEGAENNSIRRFLQGD